MPPAPDLLPRATTVCDAARMGVQTAAAKKNAKRKKQSFALSNLSLLDAALSEAATDAAEKARAASSSKHTPSFRTASSRAVLECVPRSVHPSAAGTSISDNR